MVSLAFLILPGSPDEVMKETPPIMTKMSATMPAMPMTQWMAPRTILSTLVTHALVAQFVVRLTLPRAIRIVLSMTLASSTIPRPMKA